MAAYDSPVLSASPCEFIRIPPNLSNTPKSADPRLAAADALLCARNTPDLSVSELSWLIAIGCDWLKPGSGDA